MNKKWTTKDSGEREQFPTGMQRDVSHGKPRFDLIMPKSLPYSEQPLTRWAELMQRGADKYGVGNWEKACTLEEYERYRESAMRHMIQWMCGEDDEDHMAAVLFNLSGAELVRWKLGE